MKIENSSNVIARPVEMDNLYEKNPKGQAITEWLRIVDKPQTARAYNLSEWDFS